MKITEEMRIHKAWYYEAKAQKLDSLPEFMEKVMMGYEHDYGTICHAIASCALAALCRE